MRTFTATLLTAIAYAAKSTASAESWADGAAMVDSSDIAGQASTFDWNTNFISDSTFTAGVNLQSDVYIAIEAIRLEINELLNELREIEVVVGNNENDYTRMHGEWTDADTQSDANVMDSNNNTGDIATNAGDIDAIQQAIMSLRA